MKKIFALLLFAFLSAQSFACPICGCGVGNFYMGLLPNFKSKFIGVRYQTLNYHTQLTGSPDEFSKDYYKTIELWGGFSMGKKWQLLAFFPYQVNTLKSDEGTRHLNGLGDITAIANYKLFDNVTKKEGNKSVAQELWIGGGVKLPTGKYNVDPNNPDVEIGDANSQQGTGSVDFLVNASWNVRFNKFGISTTANYKINTTNKDDYYFGNRFNASSFGYYQLALTNVILAPNIGLLYQHSAPNNLNNEKIEETGGYLAMAATGAELSFKGITIGANVQLPFSQCFAHGQTEAKTRGMLHVSFTF